jgi:hypothetical protein
MLFHMTVRCADFTVGMTIVLSSVAEPHNFYAAPAPGKNFYAAPAPAAPAPVSYPTV